MTKTLSPLAVGTILYNIVDSTVGVIPVTRVDPKLDQLTEKWKRHPEKQWRLRRGPERLLTMT